MDKILIINQAGIKREITFDELKVLVENHENFSVVSPNTEKQAQQPDKNSFYTIYQQEKLKNFSEALSEYNIEIVENQKSILVQKIKDAIVDMVFNQDAEVNVKTSVYLADTLGHSYGFLFNLFSEVTYTSIENFTILQKIEYIKQLIVAGELSLTEIAFKLNYSSLAHLSIQFKNTTGITPSAFQRIITKRRELNQS